MESITVSNRSKSSSSSRNPRARGQRGPNSPVRARTHRRLFFAPSTILSDDLDLDSIPTLIDFKSNIATSAEAKKEYGMGELQVPTKEVISVEDLPNELLIKIFGFCQSLTYPVALSANQLQLIVPDSKGFMQQELYFPPLDVFTVSQRFKLLGRETFFKSIKISDSRRIERLYHQLKLSNSELKYVVRNLAIDYEEESYGYISSFENIEQEPDQLCKKRVSLRSALGFIVRSLPCLQSLSIKSISPSDIFRDLSKVSILFNSHLYRSITSLTINGKLDCEDLRNCLINLRKLENLRIIGYESYEGEALNLSQHSMVQPRESRSFYEPILSTYAARIPLRRLKIEDSSFSKVDFDALMAYVRPNTLRMLSITEYYQPKPEYRKPTLAVFTTATGLDQQQPSLPFHVISSLTSLRLQLFNFGSPTSTLDLETCTVMQKLMKELINLRVLRLGGSLGEDSLFKKFPKGIKKLELKGCSKVSTIGLISLINNCNLKMLELWGAQQESQVSNFEIQKGAWKSGIKLKIDGRSW